MNLDRAASFCVIPVCASPLPVAVTRMGRGCVFFRSIPFSYRLQAGSLVKQSFQFGERNRYPGIRKQVPYVSQCVTLPHGLSDVVDQKFRDFPTCLPRLFHRKASEFFPGGLYLLERVTSSPLP